MPENFFFFVVDLTFSFNLLNFAMFLLTIVNITFNDAFHYNNIAIP